MTAFEWILMIVVSIIIIFFGFAGVTGSYFFDKEKSQRKSKKNANNPHSH